MSSNYTKGNYGLDDVYDKLDEAGTAYSRDVQTSSTDTTSGRVMTVGAFGLGSSTGPTVDDFDSSSSVPQGIYRFTTSSDNRPAGTTSGGAIRLNRAGNVGSWLLSDSGGGEGSNEPEFYLKSTSASAGDWSPWRKMYHQANILGTVSQSGGVPTGAIIQRGSNANGEFVRFADGTMICTRTYSNGYDFQSAISGTSINFPSAFSDIPTVKAHGNFDTLNTNNIEALDSVRCVATNISWRFMRPSSAPNFSTGGLDIPIKFTAIGRWW